MEQRHSGLGIAAFVISILVGTLLFAVFAYAGYLEITTPGGVNETAPETMLLGLAMIVLLFLDIVAAGLAIGGLFQRDRKKLFAILGCIFSVAAIALTIAIVIYGNSIA